MTLEEEAAVRFVEKTVLNFRRAQELKHRHNLPYGDNNIRLEDLRAEGEAKTAQMWETILTLCLRAVKVKT